MNLNVTRSDLDEILNNLPRLIREMCDYYIDTKLDPILGKLAEKEYVNKQLSLKLDF